MKVKNRTVALVLAGTLMVGCGGIYQLNATTLSPSQISKSGDHVYPKTGTQKNLVVLVNIKGQEFKHDEEFYYNTFYGSGVDSVASYLKDQSNGKFTISPLKTTDGKYQGIVKVDIDPDDYGTISYNNYDAQMKIVNDVMQKISSKIDLADADKNGDKKFDDTWRIDNLDSNEELNIMTIFSGSTNKTNSNGDKIQAWPHTVEMDTTVNGYVLQNSLTILSESINDSVVGTATLSHEFLHNLNARDLYADSLSVGFWSIMDSSYGNRKSTEPGNDPNPLDLLHKIRLGWVTPVEIKATDNKTYKYDKTKAYYMVNPSDKNEVYLFDYRDYTDVYEQANYRYGLRNSGLIVWKINIDSLEKDWNDDDWALNTNGARTSYYVVPFSENLEPTVDNALTSVGKSRVLTNLNLKMTVGDKSFSLAESSAKDSPVIIAIDREISKGSKFNPMETVTASSPSGDDITSKVRVTENNVNTSKEGEYKVTYSVTYNGKTTTKTVKIIVKDNTKLPVITAKNKSIKMGSKFNPLEGVTAKSHDGKDLTPNIKVVKNTVDTSKTGSYIVIYTVKDNKGASATKSIVVYVADKNIDKVDITPPVITGDSVRLIKVGDKYDPLADIKCTDDVDGDIQLNIESSNVDTSKAGIYYVTYSGTDSSYNKSVRTVRVVVMEGENVKDTEKPIIKPLAEEIEIPLGLKYDPLDFITANDNVDGNVLSKVKYTINGDKNKAGKHIIEYEVKDSSGNIGTASLSLNLVNNGAYFVIPNTVVHQGDKFDSMDNIKVYDNTGKDITSKVTPSGSTIDTSKIGTYKIKYTVGNQSYVRTVKVVDKNTAIKTPKVGESNLAENKGTKYELPKVTDGKLKDTTVNTDVVGVQNVIFTATDENGNETKELRRIIIADNLTETEPKIFLKSNVVSSGYSLKDMVIALDKKDGDITSKVMVMENNIDVKNPGLYSVMFSVTDSDGNVVNHTFDMIVRDKDNEEPKVDKEEPKDDNSNIIKDNTSTTIGSVGKDNSANISDINSLPKTGTSTAKSSILAGMFLVFVGVFDALRNKFAWKR